MADATYITIDPTTKRRKEVTFTKTGGTPTTDAQAVETDPLTGMISPTLIPSIDQTSIIAFEVIAAGALVNLFSNAGVLNMRNADNSANKPAHGWVQAAQVATVAGVFYSDRGAINSAVTGLTPETEYFLGAVGAYVTAAGAPAAGSGNILQYAGYALSATSMLMNLDNSADLIQR